MAERSAVATASRGAFLELRDEEQVVHTGYQFLDEKRMHLAAEILRQRADYRAQQEEFAARSAEAAAALEEVAATLGLDALQVLPTQVLDAAPSVEVRAFVGLSLLTARIDAGHAAGGIEGACGDAFRAVIAAGVPLAATIANLERLMFEYRRTERRVRALENVILPEIRGDLTAMEERLDLNDQEEVIRVHTLRR